VISLVQLATHLRFHDEVEVLRVLKDGEELDDVGRVAQHQDVLLLLGPLLHLGLHDETLGQLFHLVNLPGLFMFFQSHLTETAAAQQTELFQVLFGDLGIQFPLVVLGLTGSFVALLGFFLDLLQGITHQVLKVLLV